MSLNVDKSEYVVFRRQKSGGVGGTGSVYINDSNIERTDTVKFFRTTVIVFNNNNNNNNNSACGKSKLQKLNSLVKILLG